MVGGAGAAMRNRLYKAITYCTVSAIARQRMDAWEEGSSSDGMRWGRASVAALLMGGASGDELGRGRPDRR